jgi:methanogenic corrinoid protein MtbC1
LRSYEELLDALYKAVVLGDVLKARKIAEQTIDQGLPANVALKELIGAMREVDEKYEKKEFFVIDVAAAASAMREAFNVFEPHLQVEGTKVKGKIIIGALKGNVQSLGKDIVAAMLRAAGFQVVDIGVNIPPNVFVGTTVQEDAQIIAISVSMKETIPFLKDVVNQLQQKRLHRKVKILIGGPAVSEQTCEEYGVDAYGKDARDGINKTENLLRNTD